jgi:hypothetical protein
MLQNVGQESVVGIATRFGLEGPRDRIPLEKRFSVPIQTCSGAHPPNLQYKEYQVPFPGKKQQGIVLITHLQLVPRLKEENSCTSSPPLDLFGLF